MNILEKEGINPSTLGLLVFINLNSTKNIYIRNIIRQYLYEYQTDNNKYPHEILDEVGYIKYIKGTKKDELWDKVRLSDKGERILKELHQKPLHELSEFTLEYVRKEYQRIGADKGYIQGGDKLLFYISEFLEAKETYTERMIKAVVSSYCNSFQYDLKYLNKMSTLFHKPTNVYATKWTPETCPIWRYIEENQDNIKHTYRQL